MPRWATTSGYPQSCLIVGHALLLRSFWALNRDRACPSGQSAGETCSGIPQNTYDFTRALATYSG